jgi:serine/threonine-protein kinase
MPTDPASGDHELTTIIAALGAQYEIIRPLGRGGMGTVYLARERLLERLVAIKVLHRELFDAESQERFLREARAAARLTHANIVPLYSFGQSAETVFYVMGYIEGESLESLLRRSPRLPPSAVARILGELADALDYAHQHGVVHRDVKPDNIMIERATGRVVLTDFGIARVTTAIGLTKTGVIIGTPLYMSPEQAAGDREIDGRSDLYSLGLIGYRMLSGRLPFAGTSARDVLAQHLTKRPPAVASFAPDAPVTLAAAVMRCLEKEPADRWPTGAALRATLGADASNALALPDGLEHHASRGVTIAVAACAIGLFGEAVFGLSHDVWWLGFGGVASALVLTTISSSIFEARHAGLAVGQSLRALFAAPAKWSGWWPHALRRPGDVWDRLPEPVRRGRAIISGSSFAVFATLPLFVPLLAWGMTSPSPVITTKLWMIAAAANVIAIAGVATGAQVIRRWTNAHRLSSLVRRKLTMEPTWGSSFWSRPEIAPLLAPSLGTAPGAEPPERAALAGAVADLARDLEPADAQLAADVRHAVRELADAIAAYDHELAEIGAHLDPLESHRLRQRLDALGPLHGDEPEPARRVRALVAEQLALIEDLSRRYAAIEARRDAAVDRLRTLWMHLAGLRARRVMEAADAAEITDRIRALCSTVGHLNTALDELNALTPH